MSIKVLCDGIIARLKKGLIEDRIEAGQEPLLKAVYTETEYDAIQENVMIHPSAAVIYNGYTPRANPGQMKTIPGVQLVGMQFMVVLNIASAANTLTNEGVQDEVSPLFDAVLEELLGYRISSNFLPLALDPAPGAAVSRAGFGYYPVAFTTARTYRGKN